MNTIIIAITAVISFLAFSNEQLKNNMMFYPYGMNKNKSGFWRFISHGLIHADMMHLLFNMITLYFFGEYVEKYLVYHFGNPTGRMVYLGFYVLGLIVASIPSYFKHRDNQYYRSLGASGAVSAILFASIVISPLSKICLYFAICIPAYLFGPLYLLYSAYEAKRARDNVGHDAHFTGAVFGLLFIVLLVPESFRNFMEAILNLFS